MRESAPAAPLEKVDERTDRFAHNLLVAAAAFLTAEANDLEDRIELLSDERQQEGIRALLSDIADKVCDDADALIDQVEGGTWQEFCDADRAAFARRWAEVINSTNSVSIGRDKLVRHLLGLTHQLIETTLATEFDSSVGRRIGVNLVSAHFTGAETLSETLALIVERLPDLLVHAPQGVDVASRVARLTGHMATGYASALRERSRNEEAIPTTGGTTATISYAPADATDSVAALLPRIGDEDAAALDEIYRRYGKVVSTTVQSFRLQETDASDAIQMTWLRLTENAHRVQFPERLGGWLVTTARRECLGILSQAKLVPDPSEDPEQRLIDARRQNLMRMLFTDHLRFYADVAETAGIPPGGIGPTRARALRQLRDKLNENEYDVR